MIPAYKQKFKQETPVTQSIKMWSDDADAMLQNCFASTDWNIFRDSSNDNEEYTTSVTGFINKCIVRTHPNQKPSAAAFKERNSNPEAYKNSLYALRRIIKQEKRQYRTMI
jgi:hypothetical protein